MAASKIHLYDHQSQNTSDLRKDAFFRKNKIKILLAEDDVINQLYLASFLRSAGCEVDTAYNGIAVLELFDQDKYDLVILDGQMPVMDGIETAQKIRQIEKSGHIPILAISGFAAAEDQQRFIDAGMDDYLSKPVNEDELLRTIQKLTSSYFPPKLNH